MKKLKPFTRRENLSSGSKHIIATLGGIKQMLNYYYLYNSFINLPKCNDKCNLELSNYCNYLINKANRSNEFSIPKVKIDSLTALSVRSRNIIAFLGGIENMLQHFKEHNTFLNIRNSGKRTDLELRQYCQSILAGSGKPDLTELPETEILDHHDIKKCVAIYEMGKDSLSTRTSNALIKLELNNGYAASFESRFDFISNYIINSFDFNVIPNIGLKSLKELDVLRKITKAYKDSPETSESIKANIIASKINNIYSTSLLGENISAWYIGDDFTLLQPTIYLLYENKSGGLLSQSINRRILFSNEVLNLTELAVELKCTRERLRQLKQKLFDTTIPNIISSVIDTFEGKPYDVPINNNDYVIFYKCFDICNVLGIDYHPNIILTKNILLELLKEDYDLIDNYITDDLISLEKPIDQIILVKKVLNTKYRLFDLLKWCNEQIFSFASISYEFEMDALISRFYAENNQTLSKELLLALSELVVAIKKERIEVNVPKLNKLKSKRNKQFIINEIYNILNANQITLTTKQIIDKLFTKEIIVSKDKILKILNSNKSMFISTGSGNWRIKEDGMTSGLSGSFRDIIRTMLLSREEPVHISEIYDYLNKFKKVSMNSIRTNLKSETENVFHYFNCSYIGLSSVKYPEYWYKIPPFKAYHINRKFYPQTLIKDSDIIKYLSQKFGYPVKHLSFIFASEKIKRKRSSSIRKHG